MRHATSSWMILAGYCLAIYCQSSLPSPDMGPGFPGQDKMLHAVAYALLGLLACRAAATLPAALAVRTVCLTGFLFAALFGLSDEWHQSFVPGRMADRWDLLADGIGAALGVMVYGWRHHDKAASGPVFPR